MNSIVVQNSVFQARYLITDTVKIFEARKGATITSYSFETISGLEQNRSKMCVLDMDEKGNLYLYKFALLCKNEIIKRLVNGSYHIAETSHGPSAIGNSLIKLFPWHKGDL